MSAFADLPSSFREALAVYEGLRRLNFTPDEIFVGPVGGIMLVQARRAGREYTAAVGRWTGDRDMFVRLWTRTCDLWNDPTTSETDRDNLFRDSALMADAAGFVASVIARGFNVRRVDA